MSDDIAIRVNGLGKKYRIAHETASYKTLGETITRAVKSPFRRLTGGVPSRSTEEFWALKDVSFEVKRGEVVGIIGRNGAGKSTLLKILSRITTPTEGTVEVHGRIGSLLEVGTGFHPELSGRENIYLSGSILGMKRSEIDAKFDEIVKFAEMEKFLDTPVKRYSSGMYVRLAFAVAAHLEPEILIIDEVLAVGDAAFQKKCLGKMGDVAKEGRTVLFVSHNMVAVKQLCQSAILLEQGEISFSGVTENTINRYLQEGETMIQSDLLIRKDRIGSQWLKFTNVEIFDNFFSKISYILNGKDIYIRLYYASEKIMETAYVLVSFNVRTPEGYLLTNLNSVDSGQSELEIFKKGYFECHWPNFNLRSGQYACNIFCSVNGEIVDWMQNAFLINVEDGNFFHTGKLISRDQGDVLITHEWSSHVR